MPAMEPRVKYASEYAFGIRRAGDAASWATDSKGVGICERALGADVRQVLLQVLSNDERGFELAFRQRRI